MIWKEKNIEKKRKERATFTQLDEYTARFESENKDNSASTNETNPGPPTQDKPTENIPTPSSTSQSFTAPTPQFRMQDAPNKNTTFEVPSTSEKGNPFHFTFHYNPNRLEKSNFAAESPSNQYLNQSMPNLMAPPGFNNFIPPNNMNSYDGGISYPQYQVQPQMLNQYNMGTTRIIQPVRCTGRLKFFDEVQNYGFLVVDNDESDLFVHYDDLKETKISRDILRQAKTNYFLQFSFDIAFYSGKYSESKKAVNLKLTKVEKLGLIS